MTQAEKTGLAERRGVRLSLFVPVEMKAALEELAENAGRSVSSEARRAFALWVERNAGRLRNSDTKEHS